MSDDEREMFEEAARIVAAAMLHFPEDSRAYARCEALLHKIEAKIPGSTIYGPDPEPI